MNKEQSLDIKEVSNWSDMKRLGYHGSNWTILKKRTKTKESNQDEWWKQQYENNEMMLTMII